MSTECDEYDATFHCCGESVSSAEDADRAPPHPSSFRFPATPHRDSTSAPTISSTAQSQEEEFDTLIHLWSDFNIAYSPLEHGLGTAPLRIDSTRSSHARAVSASFPKCISVAIASRPASFHAQPARAPHPRPFSLAFRPHTSSSTIKTETVPLKVRVTNLFRAARDRTIGGISKRKPRRSLIAKSRRKKETFETVELRQAKLFEPEFMHRLKTPRTIRRQPAPSLDEPTFVSPKSIDPDILPATTMGERGVALPSLSRHRSMPYLIDSFTRRGSDEEAVAVPKPSFVTFRRPQSSFFGPSAVPASAEPVTSGRAPLTERNIEGSPPNRYHLPSRKMSPFPSSEMVNEAPKFDFTIEDTRLELDLHDENGSDEEETTEEGLPGEDILSNSWETHLFESYQQDSLPRPKREKQVWARVVDLGSDDEDRTAGDLKECLNQSDSSINSCFT
ncbi:BQ2448_905 [Microbotryum intermedium]|uniref:BQ2448_905 protein n=1 Tax=Microbotryum intermedium TaxID=269621 RepID=A0A238FA80_9BASI|nr:BQ2448_905 [Microbotryum intermedium]